MSDLKCAACQRSLSSPEPSPQRNDSRPVWELVIEDMQERDRTGRAKYGTPLQAHNGRRPLVDAYKEALDLVVYLRQEIEEQQAAEDQAESIRNECHALRLENARMREDTRGIIAEECGTLASELADACRERDELRATLRSMTE